MFFDPIEVHALLAILVVVLPRECGVTSSADVEFGVIFLNALNTPSHIRDDCLVPFPAGWAEVLVIFRYYTYLVPTVINLERSRTT